MTAAMSQPTVTVKDPSAVRKRRRRAPAGGASDDCFSCSKKNIKCDRRRPYCSQCLEVGSECSGYKTQLTWGVGVASRGKLRGLSLPIAKAPPVTREPRKHSTASSRSSAVTHSGLENEVNRMRQGPIDIPAVTQVASAPTTPFTMAGYDYLSIPHPEHAASMHQGNWGAVNYSPAQETAHNLHRFPVPLVTENLSSSIDPLTPDVGYVSPMSQSYTRDDVSYVHSPSYMYDSYTTGTSSPGPQSPPASLYAEHARTFAPTSCPSLAHAPSEMSSSLHSHTDTFDSPMGNRMVRDCDSFGVPEVDTYGASYSSMPVSWQSPSMQDEDVKSHHSDFAPSGWPTASENQSVHVSQDLISKMPFFMDYYENIMCPSMVFIDGPHNPFRDHILRLAVNSQSLSHAICALASCNLRMKRKLSLGRDTRDLSEKLMADKHAAEAMADTQPDDLSLAEEYQHRNLAVHLLNEQLNDRNKAIHDSVLATILLLCHYRMVESGIAKFHTQFAGVSKILALRAQHLTASSNSAWMEAIFNYFDAISASINERESQVYPGFSGASDAQLLPIGAENLVGCDRELFKTISRLGRLNQLSQNRPVRKTAASYGTQEVPERSPSLSYISPLGHARRESLTGFNEQIGDMSNVTNRGLTRGRSNAVLNEELVAPTSAPATSYEEGRSLFWHEWKEARLALQNWNFDASRVSASIPEPCTQSQLRDLESLSEAFRYAALLYTERLVSPSLPSSHQSIQSLVSQVVYYATNLDTGSSAEKFLLWPLFVAGCECVNELQQNMVRSKCRDIMFRSGYMNNLAALEVLEKLWAQDWAGEEPLMLGPRTGDQRGPFNWTKCIGGPGVEVEWIMF
ncbi:acriflavine sensitivity control ACR-2 [Fusarium beomiforme]|uniref:Acriflavine sensitivity control ACR-2 n=1 Tax=Fusarium beomiforme TaxID=44412 RepID=A0A9P5DSY5_9HYPO|nr:acriflavine sensitivity control ACR-2 [Fusarium beomiforme]